MAGNIFLVRDDQQLVELSESGYSSEDVLQRLLADYPGLLAGDQVNAAEPRQWLLVKREAPVPMEEGGSGQWSLDHLFLDQDGVPTLVEVKRASDTRSRREVVAQMLDYAANGTVYWPVERLQAWHDETCGQNGTTSEAVLGELLGPDVDIEMFWQRVKTNLQAGRIRLVFVADQIPSPLRRIVEFLNTQMDPAEVIAIEIRQYAGVNSDPAYRVLVPRVIGQTEQAIVRKSGSVARSTNRRRWDEASFFEAMRDRGFEADIPIVQAMLEWAKSQHLRVPYGTGAQQGYMWMMLDIGDANFYLFSVTTRPTSTHVTVEYKPMTSTSPFDTEAMRREFLGRLSEIPGVDLTPAGVRPYQSIGLDILRDPGSLAQFFSVYEWVINEIKAVHEAAV